MERIHGAFICARYSTDNQKADSIEVQVDKCTEYCHNNNIPILGVFADEAVSGMKDTRPQYQKMMDQLRSGIADTVVIYDQSRMFRKMTAWFAFRNELSAMSVSVVCVTQPMIGKDLRDPTNFMTEGSMALFNQIWALQSRQKTIEKMRFMARNGQHTGGKPALGYEVKDGRLVICQPEAAIVRRIFSEYAAGKSYKQIIDGLNLEGLKTKRGSAFGANSLHDLLHNEKYIGTLVYGASPYREDGSRNTHKKDGTDVIRIENAIPQIIDKELFETVQNKMQQNKRQQGGRPVQKRDYLLKGKVFCADCKSAMSVAISHGKYFYYKCSGKKRTHQCQAKPISVDELEHLVVDAVRQMLADPVNAENLITILREQTETIQGGAVTTLKNLISERDQIKKKLDNATEAVLNGLCSTTITAKIRQLEDQLSQIDAQMKTLKASVDATTLPEQRLREIVDHCIKNKDADPRALLSIVYRVEVGADAINIWTLLDTDPSGTFDETETALIIPNVRFANNSGFRFRCTKQIKRTPIWVSSLFVPCSAREGTRRIKCNSPVDCCRRRLDGAEPLSVPNGSRCKRVPSGGVNFRSYYGFGKLTDGIVFYSLARSSFVFADKSAAASTAWRSWYSFGETPKCSLNL